ncbi:thiopurine s-methyltransferase [Plakobranchus ocellatus]|uniref:thiopurine S-methyltransferase n=1 Tax=Plakobranchus ocellatus TaxID=259542 RepID=A0AAV3YGH5_9GAST|nr:thiopurine s-methyltransferase [Plakobranchus ocellatus]
MEKPDLSEGSKYWQYRYSEGHTEWQLKDVYPMLIRNYDKLNPGGKADRVFYPMCGMSLDMNWFLEQGVTVVGVEVVLQALKTFTSKSGHEWTESPISVLGPEAKLFARKDGKMKLYCGDMQKFIPQIEGRFDAIYDRGSVQFVEPANVSKYAQLMKDLLHPGGRLLLEVAEYDIKILEDENFNPPMKVPPPFSMNSDDVKRLFEPDCSVELVDQYKYARLFDKEAEFHVHLITKTPF